MLNITLEKLELAYSHSSSRCAAEPLIPHARSRVAKADGVEELKYGRLSKRNKG